ncbi:MAG: metal-sensitive transcriptional regulator [Firmicutes bacterium]|nr:metal-sensitive transcriptional regulator [Bacillota bacterium]
MSASYAQDKQDLMRRLRRIEGQIRGVQRMIEEDRYCVDILIQLAAVRAAIDKVGLALIEDHTRGCVRDAVINNRGDEAIDELMDVLAQFLK